MKEEETGRREPKREGPQGNEMAGNLNIHELPPPGQGATKEEIEAYHVALDAERAATAAKKEEERANIHLADVQSDYGRIGIIGEEEVKKAETTLEKYKRGKASLEQRIVANEQWYKLRHWEQMRGKKSKNTPEPVSAWLFNSLANKHADAMDNYPEPNVLPREAGDKEDAQILGKIIPVIMERNNFEETYSNTWWYKLKSGSGLYGVFWNTKIEDGIGDVDIQQIDILNFFWEPGIKDIQNSRNVFLVTLQDRDILEARYPFLVGRLSESTLDIAEYIYDDEVNTEDKSAVVDWYYKKSVTDEQGIEKEVLHYVKFVNGQVIYASENDVRYQERGFYDHGKYPFVFDVMFAQEGSPAGFGYLDIMKNAQMYIDKLDANIMEASLWASKPRYFIRDAANVNKEEYEDYSKTFVHVTGNLGEEGLRRIELPPADGTAINVRQLKIDEIKETSGNRDFSQGSTTSGVTAASAIAALQEAGSKLSRDMIKTSYRAYAQICYLTLELIRQFYDESREFRIDGNMGANEFVEFDNRRIRRQETDAFGQTLYRKPVFDIKIVAQKSSPFSKMAQNELAKELYGAGFFAPQMCDQALVALGMMQFEGKEEIEQKVAQNGTMYQIMQQMQADMQKMAAIIDANMGTSILESMGVQGLQQPEGAQVRGTQVTTNSLGDTQTQKTTQEAKARQKTAESATPKA